MAILAFASTVYSALTTILPVIDFNPFPFFVLPKLPLAWAAVIALAAIAFIAIEGGYSLRQAEQAKQSEKPIFGIAQLAEGVRNYVQTRNAEKEAHYVLFDKSTLSNVLGNEQEKFDAVMEYLEKSGRARKYAHIPGSWFID